MAVAYAWATGLFIGLRFQFLLKIFFFWLSEKLQKKSDASLTFFPHLSEDEKEKKEKKMHL